MRLDGTSRNWFLAAAVFCWAVGWGLAVAYGHGFDFPRMVVAIPGLALAGLLVLPVLLKGRDLWGGGLVLVVAAALFFGARALASPVWDLARMDLLLVCLGAISMLVGGMVAGSKRAVWLFLGGLLALFAANGVVAVIQETSDSSYAFLRPPRSDRFGVTGLYWHRNYLAGFLELALPVFLGVALVSRRTWMRMAFGILVVLGVVLAFYTESRGGLFSVGLGCAVTFSVWVFMGWHQRTKSARIGIIAAGFVAVVVFLIGVFAMLAKVSEIRGQSQSVDGALMDSGVRLALAGAAYDQWQGNVLIGTGARTFSYLVVRNWDWMPMHYSLGNPEMAHNDYLQTLAEYGIIGLLLALGVVVVGLGRGVRRLCAGKRDSSLPGAVSLGAVGAVCGAMAHASVDFSLHILPNTVLFGALVGILLLANTPSELSRAEQGGSGKTGESPAWSVGVNRLLASLLILLAVGGAIIAGGNELRVLPKWFVFEQGMIESGVNTERKQAFRSIIERAPRFDLARNYGRMTLRKLEGAEVGSEEWKTLVAEGLWAMEIAVDRHPLDGESRLAYANFLELAGMESQSTTQYLAGVEATWRREFKHGGLLGFSDHLARRGEGYFQGRKPERGLAFYQRALEYLRKSRELDQRRSRAKLYEDRENYLLGRIDFLEQAGIEAEDLSGEIPPPSGE